jgi:MFS family permease
MSQLKAITSQSPEAAHDAWADKAPWLAALAVVPILLTVYQTLVLTDVTSDVIRKGIEGDKYSMIWTNVCWGVATLYGVFAGLWAMPRFGARIMLQIGLVWFAVGNLLCGAAVDVTTLSAAKLVEGIGKGLVIILCRSTLYRHFDRMVIVAIGFYGVSAYATRPTTPLVTALINDAFRTPDDSAGATVPQTGSAPEAAAAKNRLVGGHAAGGLGGQSRVLLRLVSQMGWMGVE